MNKGVLSKRQCGVRSVGLSLTLKQLRAVCFKAMNVEQRGESQEDTVGNIGVNCARNTKYVKGFVSVSSN